MTLFHLWNLPGDVLTAPESVSGLDRCNIYIYLYISTYIYLPLAPNPPQGISQANDKLGHATRLVPTQQPDKALHLTEQALHGDDLR